MQHSYSLIIQSDRQGKFEVFEKVALRAGVVPETCVYDAVETMYFADSAGHHMFWIAPWDNQWIVGTGWSCDRLYRIGNSDKLDECLLELLQLDSKRGRLLDVTEDMRATYYMQELSGLEWYTAKRTRKREELARMGWDELTKDAKLNAWDQLERVCDVQTNSHSIGPQPSMAWDIQHVMDLTEESGELQELVHDLEQKCLKVMRCVGDGVWLALDFHHPSYRLHTQSMSDTLHPWPVSPFPDRDPAYFVTADFRCGILAMLRCSVSVFGQPLLDVFTQELPIMCVGKQLPPPARPPS